MQILNSEVAADSHRCLNSNDSKDLKIDHFPPFFAMHIRSNHVLLPISVFKFFGHAADDHQCFDSGWSDLSKEKMGKAKPLEWNHSAMVFFQPVYRQSSDVGMGTGFQRF